MSIQARTMSVALAVAAAITALPGTAGVVPGPCGTWFSPDPPDGGVAVLFQSLQGTTCLYSLEYLEGMFAGDPVDLLVNPSAPGIYTFTTFIPGTIVNSTTTPWDDYHYALGMGVQAAFLGFDALANPTAIGPLNGVTPFFSAPVVSDRFSMADVSLHTVAFSGGTVPNGPGNLVNFSVTVNVPAGFPGPFTLRQDFSVVPEPATLALLGLGLAGLAASRRRKTN